MKNVICAVMTIVLAAAVAPGWATSSPNEVATIFVHGFDPAGTNTAGTVGEDFDIDYAADFAQTIGLPYAINNPVAPTQVAVTTYYGDHYPSYYSQDDIDEVNAITATYGGGVPRYALIVAKYAREVMNRSGASQVNLVGYSFGGLVTRYIIEKDLENLASDKKIARWIGIAGVISGNFAATNGGPLADIFFNQYGGEPIDMEHMTYGWVTDNINDPRYSSSCEWLADFPVHFWLAADDNAYGQFVTSLSGKANDGLVLLDDAMLVNLPSALLYNNQLPTVSTLHANHNTMKSKSALYAGLAADLFGRTRVTVTLREVTVKTPFDAGATGEYVFGVKVTSPEAAVYGVADAVQDLRAEDNSLPFVSMATNVPATINLLWFDDMVLPGERELILETNVEEIDGDLIYQVNEVSGEQREALQNAQLSVDAMNDGEYAIDTADWSGIVEVDVTKYPKFTGPGGAAASDWALYQ